MKVIKRGKVIKRRHNPLHPKWVGTLIDCNHCEATYKLEAGDMVRFTFDQRDGNYWSAKCPNCGARMSVSA